MLICQECEHILPRRVLDTCQGSVKPQEATPEPLPRTRVRNDWRQGHERLLEVTACEQIRVAPQHLAARVDTRSQPARVSAPVWDNPRQTVKQRSLPLRRP